MKRARWWGWAAAITAGLGCTLAPVGAGWSDGTPQSDARSTSQLPAALRLAFVQAVQNDAAGSYAVAAGEAFNEAHGLAASFAEHGLVIRRAEHEVNVSLAGFGCVGAVAPSAHVVPKTSANRVEYDRGDLTEWYLNGPLGLEQGFTFARDPRCPGEIEIDLTMRGSLTPSGQGEHIALLDSEGKRALSYGDLLVVDAAGQALPAALHARGSSVALTFDARGARFPVTVDPTFAFARKVVNPSGGNASDQFGLVVAMQGDTAMVSASLEDISPYSDVGAVYVFARTEGGWEFAQRLVSPTTYYYEYFGSALALDGDQVLIGAYYHDYGYGGAYVYGRGAEGWEYEAFIANPDPHEDVYSNPDYFGQFLDLDGNTAVIGAYASDASDVNSGVAYVFEQSESGWNVVATLTNPDGESASDYLGRSVAIDADTALAGAPDDEGGGSVFVYERSEASWGFLQKLQSPDGETDGDLFGTSLALAGDTLLIGAPHNEGAEGPWAGSVYVYTRSGGLWIHAQTLDNPDATAPFDFFGRALALDGNTLLVGANGDESYAGAALVYTRTDASASWTYQGKLSNPDESPVSDNMGTAVALSGDYALLGAYADAELAAQAGAAFFFEVTTCASANEITFSGGSGGSSLGGSSDSLACPDDGDGEPSSESVTTVASSTRSSWVGVELAPPTLVEDCPLAIRFRQRLTNAPARGAAVRWYAHNFSTGAWTLLRNAALTSGMTGEWREVTATLPEAAPYLSGGKVEIRALMRGAGASMEIDWLNATTECSD